MAVTSPSQPQAEAEVREMFLGQALNEALDEEMARDPTVFLLGEEVGVWGGAYNVSAGLLEKWGPERIVDTPISEAAIVGAAVGAALTGMRPIPEIMYSDFLGIAMDQVVNQAAKNRYMFGGKAELPITLRTTFGGGTGHAGQHSGSPEAWFTHVPGLKVVTNSTPHDAKGLLKSAIRDDNVVIFFEHKAIYNQRGHVPKEDYTIPLGVAQVRREGSDCTVITYARQVLFALEAAEQLASDGISVEVIDLRTLYPLDIETVLSSVRKTNRAVIVHDAVRFSGFGAEITSQIQELAFDYLDAPVGRLGGAFVPIPFSQPLENIALPNADGIAAAVRNTLQGVK
jgi:pyruvate dehydrogenase E1 component beta subunit